MNTSLTLKPMLLKEAIICARRVCAMLAAVAFKRVWLSIRPGVALVGASTMR